MRNEKTTKKENNMTIEETTFICKNGNKILETELGFYSVQEWKGNDYLIYYYDKEDLNVDNGCDVSDLSDLTTEQYQELDEALQEHFNYGLAGRFI